MQKGFISNHFLADGMPAGGTTYGNGFCIGWQNGPLGRGEERQEPNGAFVEDVIAAVIDRIAWYQNTGSFWCQENADALAHLQVALQDLKKRTKRRETAGVEGTHQGN